MANPFKGGGDGGSRDGGDKTDDGGGFFKSAWEAVSQDIWGGPPQRKQESSTTPENPVKKAFDAVSHLSLDAIPAISQKIIDKIQPGEKAEKQLKEINEKPLQNPRENIFQSVEIEAHAENGDPVAIDTLKMLKKAGDNKDWRTIIKEAYTNVITQFKNFISGGDNQLQEAPQAVTGSLDAVNKTRFETKVQEDLSLSNPKTRVKTHDSNEEKARDDWPVITPEQNMIRVGGQVYQPDQLIAANVTPNNPIVSDATLPGPDEVQKPELPGDAIAWGEDTIIPRVTMPSTDRLIFPYRGQEDQRLSECTKENPNAWTDAFDVYPKLEHYLSREQASKLMKALVRNELHWFDVKDKGGDKKAKEGNPDPTETLGYSQITPNGVSEFETGIIKGQKVREPDLKLTEFLKEKGYSGDGHETKALEDPSCVPMIVAAKLNTLIDLYEKSGTVINYRTLAYGYNADVYYNPSNPNKFHSLSMPGAAMIESQLGNKKAFPTDSENALNASSHLKNIEKQMQLIQQLNRFRNTK